MRITERLLASIRKILEMFKADTDNYTLTNKVILDELTQHFKNRLQSESVGQRMLYPMSFNILMDPQDYDARIQAIPFILPVVVDAFYGIMKDALKKNNYKYYDNSAEYWFFQFTSCQTGTMQSDNLIPVIVKRGHITTVASLLTFDINEVNNTIVDTNVRVSIKLNDSYSDNTNLNFGALRHLDIVGEGIYKCPFHSTLNPDMEELQNYFQKNTVGIAELSYSRNGRNFTFFMKDNLIHISGKNEMRNGSSFFKIEEEDISDSHVQIRYIPEGKKFQIAAFGPTRLNSGKMNESSGGNILWYDLANNSNIFINDKISVKFRIK